MKLPPLAYARAASVAEAVALLKEGDGEARIIAGGQSLLPVLAFRLAAPALLVDIGGIDELKAIKIGPDFVTLGALVRWRDIERDARLAAALPLLPAAIAHVAHYQIRNRGTVGGSLAHCDPAAEMPGLAVACDAQIVLEGPDGRRVARADEVLVAALCAEIAPDEMIVAVRFPAWPQGRRWAFQEYARRRGDFALAGIALHYDLDADGAVRDAHVGVIGAADRPMRLAPVEAALDGRRLDPSVIRAASEAAQEAVEPPDDIHASADYRRALVGVLVERALCAAEGLAPCGIE
ncbi:MAG: xanthine dehydrogenase family protein subunit M [Pseudomonadota bacterium]